MALCSYDNELNQKYNFNKELDMTPAQKKAQEAKEAEALRLAEEAKAQEAKEAEATVGVTDTDVGDMNILQAFEAGRRLVKVGRRGWSKELDSSFVTILRGHTKPSLSNGKHSSPYTPSIEDVLTVDWYIKDEEV